jgi:uncharacterized ParB-like nuclease family protein
MRGFLSSRYRRLDSRPLLEAFAIECQKINAVPIDGTVSDVRCSLKAIVPQIYEPLPGEVLAFGVEWHNSDYGAGTHAIRAFILRVWCLNGATLENSLAQIHLGRNISDEFDVSNRTYKLDTAASVSALRDVVSGVLMPHKIDAMCETIKKAHEQKVEWKNIKGSVGRKLLKGELELAQTAFDGPDVINLPPEKTLWRASNALSWVAGSSDNPDRKIELQRIAGELLTGKKDEAVKEAA